MASKSSVVRPDRLEALIRREMEQPRPFEQVADELEQLASDDPQARQLGQALRVLAAADRRRFYVKSEGAWFRKFGFRIMRPMLTACVIAAVVYTVQKAVDPVLGLSHFMLGVASLYVLQQVYIHFWSRHDEDKLQKIDDELCAKLRSLLDDGQ